MTTYTMNGHRHSTAEVQPEILMGIVGNRVAQIARAQWRLQTRSEKFSCLDSADPQIQLQAALAQIETLLQRNAQLLETVFLLNQALNDTHSLIYNDESSDRQERDKLQLSHDFHGCIEALSGELQLNALE